MSERRRLSDITYGLVYFIETADGSLIKIGWSRYPVTRVENLATWSPVPLHLSAAVEGSRTDEKRLHYRFREQWSHHEWFRPSAELLAVVDHVRATGRLPADDTPYDIVRLWLPPQQKEGRKRRAEKLSAIWKDPAYRADRLAQNARRREARRARA